MSRQTRSRAGGKTRSQRTARPGRIRIIGGRLRGRFLDVPSGASLRPTPNRVRETLFNWLAGDIEGARCLDLFAGSGALGLEALSRGAAAVTFVEADARVAAVLRDQLAAFDMHADVLCAPAAAFLADAPQVFDIAFVDPPFEDDAVPVCRAVLSVLRPGGVLYCERAAEDALPDLGTTQWVRAQRAGQVRYGIARKPARKPDR